MQSQQGGTSVCLIDANNGPRGKSMSLFEPALMPKHEDHQSPEFLSMIGSSGEMFLLQFFDVHAVEYVAFLYIRLRKKISAQRLQLALQPLADRHAESLLISFRA